jgi:hypothetical protein
LPPSQGCRAARWPAPRELPSTMRWSKLLLLKALRPAPGLLLHRLIVSLPTTR